MMSDTTCLRCGAKLTMGADLSGLALPSPHVCRPVTRVEFDALEEKLNVAIDCLLALKLPAGAVEIRNSNDPWMRLLRIRESGR